MTNHVHLLLTPSTDTAVSQVVQSLGRKYVRYFNDRYGRTGTLWEGRYKAALIDTEPFFLICSRYIELNPVRAGMVGHPAEHRWSSYLHNATGQGDPLVTKHPLYVELGADPGSRQAAYRALFDVDISDTTLSALREATNKSWVFGNDRFRERY